MLFETIDTLNIQKIKKYIISHPNCLQEKSPNGFSPLAYLTLKMLNDNKFSTQGKKEKYLNIGILLISLGDNYNSPLGKTQRSIKISEKISHIYPDIHEQWLAVQKQKEFFQLDEIQLNLLNRTERPKKKI